MKMDAIYKFLCSFYGVTPKNMPSRYLIDKPVQNADLTLGNMFGREAIFAIKDFDNVWSIGIFINPKILAKIEAGKFSKDDLACVIEGVSHFIYLMSKIENEEKTSIFELELQAEVDKFIYLSAMVNFQPDKIHNVYNILFEGFKFNSDLNKDEMFIYEKANYFAKSFCADLMKRIQGNFHEFAKKKAIRFYHEPLQSKLLEIHT